MRVASFPRFPPLFSSTLSRRLFRSLSLALLPAFVHSCVCARKNVANTSASEKATGTFRWASERFKESHWMNDEKFRASLLHCSWRSRTRRYYVVTKSKSPLSHSSGNFDSSRGNFPVFRCSVRSHTAVNRITVHRITSDVIPYRHRRSRFPVCRFSVKYARLSRIEISLNFVRVVSRRLLPFRLLSITPFASSYPRNAKKGKWYDSKDNSSGIGGGENRSRDEVLDLRNESIFCVRERYRKTFDR